MKSRPRMKYKGYDPQGYKGIGNGKYSDESDDEDIDLPIRKVYKPQHFVEAQVQEGDTLQAIALRFNCTVSTIMRANNILRENEIFAKRVLKIPVTAYSLLTEGLPLVHTSGHNSPTRSNGAKNTENNKENIPLATDNEFQQKLIVASVNASEIKLPKYSNASSLHGDNVFPSTSKDFNYVSRSIPIDQQISNEINLDNNSTPLLIGQRPLPQTVESTLITEFTTRGADFGIKWIHLIGCALMMAFIIPLIYVVYIAEHPEKYPHYGEHHHH